MGVALFVRRFFRLYFEKQRADFIFARFLVLLCGIGRQKCRAEEKPSKSETFLLYISFQDYIIIAPAITPSGCSSSEAMNESVITA